MLASPDGVDLHRLVEGFAVEAVAKVHNAAPSLYLDGQKGTLATDYSADFDQYDNGVVVIKMLKDTLRVASVKASDSNYVVANIVAEDSAEGRKQQNKYVRGVPDDPCVVLQKVWSAEYKPVLKYYSTTATECPVFDIEYIPYPEIEEAIIMICPKLEYHVLNEIAAMVLDALNEHDKAAMYHTKAQEF